MDHETYGISPEEEALRAEELMMQEELRLMQEGGISDICASSDPPAEETFSEISGLSLARPDGLTTAPDPVADVLPTELDTDVVEPIDDDDVAVEGSTLRNRISILFADPRIKWGAIAVLALFALWLITSGVLWAIIKFLFKLIMGLLALFLGIYIVSRFIPSDETK